MDYTQAISYLYASLPTFHQVGGAAYKPGPDNILALMDHLGRPHERVRTIHIAGTNGKGSTSHLIAAALQCAGHKVGLYTSPHLVDFRERIRINGVPVPEGHVVRWVNAHKAFLDRLHPSFFETTFAMAMDYFEQERVDIAVIEVGLGGRLDATNIIHPLLSVITNIGFDHTEFLGNTLPKIAREKAGIIKPGVPCVIGETDATTMNVFLDAAREADILGDGLETTNCRIWFADQCNYLRRRRLREAPGSELQGDYQDKNLQTAYVALKALSAVSNQQSVISGQRSEVSCPPMAIREGFAHVCSLTGLRGRWETLCEAPLTICDTGHNAHGIRYVAKQLRALDKPLHIVFGQVNDKDVELCLSLLPEEASYYFCQAQTKRAVPADELLSIWHTKHPDHTRCAAYASVAEALKAAQTHAKPTDVIFIGGSNYVVGEMLKGF